MIRNLGIVWVLLLSSGLCMAAFDLHAAEAIKIEIQNGDSIKSILVRQTGKQVKLRLKGGEEFGGVVMKVGDNVVHLSELTGREFYDAAIGLDAISAVIVRAR